jgi:hypothetical protein
VSCQLHANSPRHPLDRRLGGLRNRSGRCGEDKNLALTRTRTRTPRPSSPQPVAIQTTLSRLFLRWTMNAEASPTVWLAATIPPRVFPPPNSCPWYSPFVYTISFVFLVDGGKVFGSRRPTQTPNARVHSFPNPITEVTISLLISSRKWRNKQHLFQE